MVEQSIFMYDAHSKSQRYRVQCIRRLLPFMSLGLKLAICIPTSSKNAVHDEVILSCICIFGKEKPPYSN